MLNVHSPGVVALTANSTTPLSERDTAPLTVFVSMKSLSSEETSLVAVTAKLEMSTADVRGSPKRSLNVAEKTTGDVVVRPWVSRDTSAKGANSPGLKASEEATKEISIECTTLPSKSNAWISPFAESPTRMSSLASSARTVDGAQLVRVVGQEMKGEQPEKT
jgi:hypothetical protein